MPHTRNPRLLIACGWLWSLIALVPATNAGWSLQWQLLLLPSGLVLACRWLSYPSRFPGGFPSRRSVAAWLSVPVAGLAVVVLSFTNYGLALRVWLCEDELRAFAEAARAGREDVGANGPHDCRVGLFEVERTVGFGSDVNLITARRFGGSYGVTYWPECPPNESRYRHLYGPWYHYYDDW